MGMLSLGDPFAIADVTEKGAPTDWGKVEAYTQGSFALATALQRMPLRVIFDTCVLTHLDIDHVRSALFHSANFNRHLAASYHTAASCKNLMLLLPESNLTTNASVFSVVGYNAHEDLKPSDALWLYTDLLERSADPLDGYEQYEKADWDGHGAEPITAVTLEYARRLMKIMPTSLGTPDAAPAGDGCIALEWVPEDQTHKLDRLFIDIGPGEVWRAYWSLRSGEFNRVTGQGFFDDTKAVLKDIFQQLST